MTTSDARRSTISHVNVLGGGQLGRMMAPSAHRLGLHLTVLDPQGSESPAGQLASSAITGTFTKPEDVRRLVALTPKASSVLTVEIEHIHTQVLADLAREGYIVQPPASTLTTIQDKYAQKQFLERHGIPVAEYCLVPSLEEAKAVGQSYGYPWMLKSRRWAYDGKGNCVVHSPDEVAQAYAQLNPDNRADCVYGEKWVPYIKELAIMIVRGSNSTTCDIQAYPVVETIQQDNICHLVLAPARVSATVRDQVTRLASKAVEHLDGCGVFGVECFVTQDQTILLNEIAPRPHNSGHYSIEACETDQFENHLRAVSGLPLGSCALKVGAALMINVLGQASEGQTYDLLNRALEIPGAAIHRYGKSGPVKLGRKLAHVTITGQDLTELQTRVKKFQNPELLLPFNLAPRTPVVGIIMGSDSDLPCMQAAVDICERFNVLFECTIVSAHRTPRRMVEYATRAQDRGLRVLIAGAGGAAHLPGMVASLTNLPVIGVPIQSKALAGIDSLYSIVQMPRGVPVATVGIGNATNAGLLAIRIVGLVEPRLWTAMTEFVQTQEAEVHTKIDTLERLGVRPYLNQM